MFRTRFTKFLEDFFFQNIIPKNKDRKFDLEKLISYYDKDIDTGIIKIEKKENIKHVGGYFEIKYLEEYIELCMHHYFQAYDNKAKERKVITTIKHKDLDPIFLEELKHKQVLKFEILPPT